MDIFAQRLKGLREGRGISVSEAARGMGVMPGTYLRWEKGLGKRDLGVLVKIVRYYGVSADYLLGIG
jgi:transcriptional regulator with XRE-family HTH domain